MCIIISHYQRRWEPCRNGKKWRANVPFTDKWLHTGGMYYIRSQACLQAKCSTWRCAGLVELNLWEIEILGNFVSWSDVGKALSENVLVDMTWMPNPFCHLSPANKSSVHRQLLSACYLLLSWLFIWLFNVNYLTSIVSNAGGKKASGSLPPWLKPSYPDTVSPSTCLVFKPFSQYHPFASAQYQISPCVSPTAPLSHSPW